MPAKKRYSASAEDVPHISCQVCEQAVREIFFTVAKMRINKPKLEEEAILAKVEQCCSPKSEAGRWIKRYDIQPSGSTLLFVDKDSSGKCRSECATVAKACENTLSDIDTELGELLWQNQLSRDDLVLKVCHDMVEACPNKLKKPVKADREDEQFILLTEEESNVEEMMEKMGGIPGMGGDLYSREDIETMTDQYGGEADPVDKEAAPMDEPMTDVPPASPSYSSEVTLLESLRNAATGSWNWVLSKLGYTKSKEEL